MRERRTWMIGRVTLGIGLLGIVACGTVESGPGWELVAFDRHGPTYSVMVAETEADQDRIWERFALPIESPVVDYSTQVLIGLGHAVSGSCPGIEFRGLVMTDDRVFGRYNKEEPFPVDGCTADANPAMFWIRAERSSLPEVFTLTLAEQLICGGCPEERAAVDLTSDRPDASQWWASSRLLIAYDGAVPADAYAIRTRFDGREDLLAIFPVDWQPGPQWVSIYEGPYPSRVEAFTATCADDRACSEDHSLLDEVGPVCGVDVVLPEREDRTALITFADDGSCLIEVIDRFEPFE